MPKRQELLWRTTELLGKMLFEAGEVFHKDRIPSTLKQVSLSGSTRIRLIQGNVPVFVEALPDNTLPGIFLRTA